MATSSATEIHLFRNALGQLKPRSKQSPRHISHEHERTRQAEKVSRTKQHQNQRAAEVYPREHSREVFWRQSGTKQPVEDHHDGNNQQRNLQYRARMPPAQKTAEDRNAKQVEVRSVNGQGCRIGGWRGQ